jgi:hypothetical protein
MQALPTDPVMSIDRAGMASGNAMANARDAPELFGVEVQQLARVRPLVAHDRRRRVKRSEPIEAEPAQDFGHRRVWHAELPRNRWRAHPLPPQPFDVGDALRRRAAHARGPRAAIQQRDLAATLPAPNPFAYGLLADAQIARDLDGPLAGTNAASHQEATVRGGARILVDVHPGPRLGLLTVDNHQFLKPASGERANNLCSNHN